MGSIGQQQDGLQKAVSGSTMAYEPVSGGSKRLNGVDGHALDGGDDSLRESSEGPLLAVNKVQFTMPGPLVHLLAANNTLVLVFDNSVQSEQHEGQSVPTQDVRSPKSTPGPVTVVRLNLDDAELLEECLVPIPAVPDQKARHAGRTQSLVKRAHLDPSGKHLILADYDDRLYYLHSSWNSARALPKTRGCPNTIAWNKSTYGNDEMSSTGNILVGMSDGTLHNVVLDPNTKKGKEEKYTKVIYTILEGAQTEPILGLLAESFPGKPDTWLILLLTPNKLVQIIGSIKTTASAGHFDEVVQVATANAQPYSQSIPSQDANSRLYIAGSYKSLSDYAASSTHRIAIKCQGGAFLGTIQCDSQGPGENVIEDGQMQSFSSDESAQTPFDIALLDYHIILACQPRSVKALCTLDNSIRFSETIPTIEKDSGLGLLGITKDPIGGSVWAWTHREIFEIVVADEKRHIWTIYEKLGRWEAAEKTAPDERSRDRVRKAQGWSCLKNGQELQAALAFAKSNEAFERVCLEFMRRDEADALRVYLSGRMKRLHRDLKAQRLMLGMWLVELYLERIATFEDDIAGAKVASAVSLTASETSVPISDDEIRLKSLLVEFQDFLVHQKDDLDASAVFSLLSQHGRHFEQLHYASAINDTNRMIDLYIRAHEWQEALLVIAASSELEQLYRHVTVLMRHAPRATVDLLIRMKEVEYSKVLGALLWDDDHTRVESIRYHEHLIRFSETKSTIVHNVLMGLFCQSQDSAAILEYISATEWSIEANLDFVLRLCRQHGLNQAAVRLCGALKLYDLAVAYAIEADDMYLAQEYADNTNGESGDAVSRKRRWLSITKFAISKYGPTEGALKVLDRTDCIEIADILSLNPNLTRIDTFKPQIVATLEKHGSTVQHINEEILENEAIVKALKFEESLLQNRRMIVQEGEQCFICFKAVATRPFLIFPCQHAFHENCLITKAKSLMTSAEQKRFSAVQAAIVELHERDLANPERGQGIAGYAAIKANQREGIEAQESGDERETPLDSLMQKLSDMLECILCGEPAIRAMDAPFGSKSNFQDWLV